MSGDYFFTGGRAGLQVGSPRLFGGTTIFVVVAFAITDPHFFGGGCGGATVSLRPVSVH
jgi:hypothetical protein